MMQNSLGKNLKFLREKRGYTQTKLADKAGIAQSIISDIESGNRNPRTDTIIKLSKALGVTLSELLDVETNYQ